LHKARVARNAVNETARVFCTKHYYVPSFVFPVPQLLGSESCRGAAEKAVSSQNDNG
jgi:hypothetical protein